MRALVCAITDDLEQYGSLLENVLSVLAEAALTVNVSLHSCTEMAQRKERGEKVIFPIILLQDHITVWLSTMTPSSSISDLSK